MVRTGSELIFPHQKTEFHADWIRPNGLDDGLADGWSPHLYVFAGDLRDCQCLFSRFFAPPSGLPMILPPAQHA